MRLNQLTKASALAIAAFLWSIALAGAGTVVTKQPYVQGQHVTLPIAGLNTITVGGLTIYATPGITFQSLTWNSGSASGGTPVTNALTIGHK